MSHVTDPPVRLVSSPSCCLVSGLDDASRSEGVQVPTSYSVVERVNERALVSSDRELLFSSSAQARVGNGSQVTFKCQRSCRARGDSPLESHNMVEQMEQMLALDTVECEAEVGELFGRQNTSPRACSQCCEERPVELRRTCNRT